MAKILQDKLTNEYGVELNVASNQQIYRSLALICRQMMSENHKKFQSKAIGTGSKQVYYLCMEFLMGRSLKMSLFNLGLNDAAQKALAEADISLDSIYEEEPDAGLGNGRPGPSGRLLSGRHGHHQHLRHRLLHPVRVRHLQAEDRGRLAAGAR